MKQLHFEANIWIYFERLQHLFNGMLRHGFVPAQFRLGTIIPIVKDRHGDQGDLNNYRGITIAPIYSKVFEHVLQIMFKDYLSTSSYQFGFKRKSSTSHAIFVSKRLLIITSTTVVAFFVHS